MFFWEVCLDFFLKYAGKNGECNEINGKQMNGVETSGIEKIDSDKC